MYTKSTKFSKATDFPMEVQAQRAYDYDEIKKIMGKRAYLMSTNRRAEELDTLWTKENQATASYGRNWGYYVGMDNIRAYYVDKNPFGGEGTAICHPFTTHKIHIADDGKTAQVTWYSIGYEIVKTDDGFKGYWDNQRCGCDLIREAEGWKIWHYFAGTDFCVEPGYKYADLNVFEYTPEEQMVKAEFGTPTVAMDAYNCDYNYFMYPAITREHATFADTVSNGPEGNPMFTGYRKPHVSSWEDPNM